MAVDCGDGRNDHNAKKKKNILKEIELWLFLRFRFVLQKNKTKQNRKADNCSNIQAMFLDINRCKDNAQI